MRAQLEGIQDIIRHLNGLELIYFGMVFAHSFETIFVNVIYVNG